MSSESISSHGHEDGSSSWVYDVVPPPVAAVLHVHVAAGAPDDEAGLHRGCLGHRLVGDRLERRGGAAPVRGVLGDQVLALHVDHPAAEGVGAEATEDEGEGGPEPGQRQQGDRRLGDHAHVDGDLGALADAEALEPVRGLDHPALQVGVGDGQPVVGGLALPVVGDLVAEPVLDVPVDAVVADVELAAEVPLGVRALPLLELVERGEPADPLPALPLPERVGVLLVEVRRGVGLLGERGVRWVTALLRHQRVDVLGRFCHLSPLFLSADSAL